MLDRGMSHLQENRKETTSKWSTENIAESEIKDIKEQMQYLQKISKGFEEKYFSFAEDTKKKKDLSLLWATSVLKWKAEERKQDMSKLKETPSVIAEKVMKYLSYLGTAAYHLYWLF